MAKKLIQSVLSKATRIHLIEVAHENNQLAAKVQFEGSFYKTCSSAKGLR
ncbi:MAG: hypothetical protein R3B54_15200 [Bdellovibrionota bacterium]